MTNAQCPTQGAGSTSASRTKRPSVTFEFSGRNRIVVNKSMIVELEDDWTRIGGR